MIEVIGWILIIASFVIAYVGTFYPIIPSVVFMLLGYILYGLFFSFTELTWLFWTIQILFVILLFGADMAANALGVKNLVERRPEYGAVQSACYLDLLLFL